MTTTPISIMVLSVCRICCSMSHQTACSGWGIRMLSGLNMVNLVPAQPPTCHDVSIRSGCLHHHSEYACSNETAHRCESFFDLSIHDLAANEHTRANGDQQPNNRHSQVLELIGFSGRKKHTNASSDTRRVVLGKNVIIVA